MPTENLVKKYAPHARLFYYLSQQSHSRIIELLKNENGANYKWIAEKLDMAPSGAIKAVKKMHGDGILEKQPAGDFEKYKLANPARISEIQGKLEKMAEELGRDKQVIASTLAKPGAIGLLHLMGERKGTASELVERLQTSESKESPRAHVKSLTLIGMVRTEKEGGKNKCSLAMPEVLELIRLAEMHFNEINEGTDKK